MLNGSFRKKFVQCAEILYNKYRNIYLTRQSHTHQSDQPISIKHKIMLRCFCITDKCMHATNLQKEARCFKFNQLDKVHTFWMKKHTWKVVWITYRLGYILQRSCWPSFVRICCTIRSTATSLSPPRGIIISAYFFVGSMKSSKAGFTNFEYCSIIQEGVSLIWHLIKSEHKPKKCDLCHFRYVNSWIIRMTLQCHALKEKGKCKKNGSMEAKNHVEVNQTQKQP